METLNSVKSIPPALLVVCDSPSRARCVSA